MRDWILGSQGRIVSMGVYSAAAPYDVDKDLIFSFPVISEPGGTYVIRSTIIPPVVMCR